MPDNQLSHDELIRLEAITRSINLASFMTDIPDADKVVENASKFEDFLKNGSNNA